MFFFFQQRLVCYLASASTEFGGSCQVCMMFFTVQTVVLQSECLSGRDNCYRQSFWVIAAVSCPRSSFSAIWRMLKVDRKG